MDDSGQMHAGRVTRRRFLAAAGGSAAALAAPVRRARAQQTTLRFLNAETDPNTVKFLQQAAAEWKDRTGVAVEVESVPLGDVFPKLTTSIKAGRPYDVGTLAFVGHVILLAREGHLAPVTRIVEKIGRNDFGPRVLFPWRNEVWWYPYDYNLAYLFARKDWLAEKGLKAPKSHAEWVSVSKALTGGERYGTALPVGSNGATNWVGYGPFAANNVRWFDDRWNVVLDSPAEKKKAVAALELYKTLWATMPPGMASASFAEMLNAFSTGRAGIVPYTGRMIHHIERNSPELADKYEILPFPAEDGKGAGVTHGYDGWLVMKGPNQAEALKFVEWLGTDRLVDFLHTVALHYQPCRLSVYKDQKWRSHPLVQKHWGAMETMRGFLDGGVTIASLDTDGPEVDPRPGIVWEGMVYPELLQAVILKNVPPAEAVSQAAARARQLVAGR